MMDKRWRTKVGTVLLTAAAALSIVGYQAAQGQPVQGATTTSSATGVKQPAASGQVTTTKTDKGYDMQNNLFKVSVGQYGEISGLYLANDAFKTNYVMNETDNPKQATPGHEWVGELMFRTKPSGAKDWQKEYTNKSGDVRKVSLDGNRVVVTYTKSGTAGGIKSMTVTETYALVGDNLQWSIKVQNTTANTLTIGDMGLPLPFREYWTYPPKEGESPSQTAYEGSTLFHSFVGQDASYIYVNRPSGVGNYLVMTPDQKSGAGFEYQDHWIDGTNGRTADEKNWCMDQGDWANGLNVFYIHSAAIKNQNEGYLPNTTLTLKAGESKTYTFNFNAAEDKKSGQSTAIADQDHLKYDKSVAATLYQKKIMDAVSVPSMVLTKNDQGVATGKMYLHTSVDKKDISFTYQCMHTGSIHGGTHNIMDTKGVKHVENGASATFAERKVIDGEQYLIYNVKFSELGPNNIIVHYSVDGQEKKTTLQYTVIDNPQTALADHADFLLKTQWQTPGKLQDKVFDDWMMDTKSKRNEFAGYYGWGDDWGLTHATFLAEMNSMTPKVKQVQAIDEYLDTAIWNGLMQEHHDDYLINDFLMKQPNTTPTYRGFAYPHIYNTYFAMYKIASQYPDLIQYKDKADTYLLRAYHIMKAMYADGVGYNWETGTMGESSTPAIIQALKDRGYAAEAQDITDIMAKKYQNFAKDKYPYVSEYPYDNTSEEAVYMLGQQNNDQNMMSMIDLKTRASRGVQPVWYRYGVTTPITGENWFTFQYSCALVGIAMDDWLRVQNNGLNQADLGLAERANYAGKLANLTLINSGQMDSDPANIGTTSWTYQAQLGNYEALGTGGGNMHNGWRQMSGESDLALWGALQTMSADVVTDPVFGLTGYGATVRKQGRLYFIKPEDGLRQRVNLINDKLSYAFANDKYTQAVIDPTTQKAQFQLTNTAGEAHDAKLVITHPQAKTQVFTVIYNGKTVGSFEANGTKITVTIPVTAAKKGLLTIQPGKLLTNTKPTVTVPDKLTTSMSQANDVRLIGHAEDKATLQKQPAAKWTVVQAPEGGKATFSAADNAITSAQFNKAGHYVVQLTATGANQSTAKTVSVDVQADQPLPETVARYGFDVTDQDIIAHRLPNEAAGGPAAELYGTTDDFSTVAGKTGKALAMSGKVAGYLRLPAAVTERLQETTLSLDVRLSGRQVTGTTIYQFADEQQSLALQVNGSNELYLNVKDAGKTAKEIHTGVALPADQWENITLTLTNHGAALYLNGKVIKTLPQSTLTLGALGKVQKNYIGRATSQAAPWFHGALDNFVLRSKALSAAEINKLYGNDEALTIKSLDPATAMTSVKTAPQLPQQVQANYSDGTKRAIAVTWAEVDPEQYAKAGSFKVTGTIAESKALSATVTVQVVAGKKENLAKSATPTAIIDTPEDLGGVKGLNDGFTPANSDDRSHGVWHNWHGDQTADAWVQYAWKQPVLLTDTNAYYFFDGSNFDPSAARFQYQDDQGKWQDCQNVQGAGTTLNQFNKTTFTPVTTKTFRMILTPGHLGIGVIEWQVNGYTVQ